MSIQRADALRIKNQLALTATVSEHGQTYVWRYGNAMHENGRILLNAGRFWVLYRIYRTPRWRVLSHGFDHKDAAHYAMGCAWYAHV